MEVVREVRRKYIYLSIMHFLCRSRSSFRWIHRLTIFILFPKQSDHNCDQRPTHNRDLFEANELMNELRKPVDHFLD